MALLRWRPEPGWPVESISAGVASLGYAPEDFSSGGLGLLDIIHPEDRARVAEEVRGHTEAGVPSFVQEYRILGQDGRTAWLFARTLVERDAAGRAVAYVGYVLDISDLRCAEARARDVERFRDVVLDNLPGVIVEYLDRNLRVRWASPSLARQAGCEGGQALGRPCYELLQGATEPCPWCTASEALQTGAPRSGDAVTPDGRSWWLASTPLTDACGRVEGVVHVATDVTARAVAEQALRDSEERLRLLVDNMPVLICAYDAQGRCLFWNREAERVLGWSAEQAAGSPGASRLLYPDDAYRTGSVGAARAVGDYRSREFVARCADGSHKIIAWSNLSGRLPIPGWATWEIGLDVTEQRAAEDRRADVERILRHDLKRPLVQAVELVVLLREMGGPDLKYADHFADLEAGARRSLRMIDGYVRLQALESGRAAYPARRVDLDELVAEVLRECAPRAEAHGVRLELEAGAEGGQDAGRVVFGDPALLWAMLTNLVSNAVEASARDGAVRVAVGRRNGTLRLTVWNARPIPEELRPVFFEKFATQGKSDGLGLGAFSARLIARAHGGDVVAESDAAVGTLLIVTLPLQG